MNDDEIEQDLLGNGVVYPSGQLMPANKTVTAYFYVAYPRLNGKTQSEAVYRFF